MPLEPTDLTTMARTLVRGPANGLGWCPLVRGVGEPHESLPPTTQVLAAIWHLSDLHLCDVESPIRLEYLDRFSDPDSPYREELGHVGTYRPQEIFTTQVMLSMLSKVNRLRQGPTTGRPIDAVVITGDLIDNAQANELQWLARLLEGGTVSPRSGDETQSSWVGAIASDADQHWDERYWHPDGPGPAGELDLPTRVFGFPRIPGLVDRARQDLHSPGVAYPVLAVHGNHDLLLQGTVVADARLREAAIGAERVTGLAAHQSPMVVLDAVGGIGPARYIDDEGSPRQQVLPDDSRSVLHAAQFAATVHHNLVPESFQQGPGNCWTAEVGELRVIALDTVNPHGGWQGSIDLGQRDWLVTQLAQHPDRYTIITSHHPSVTMINDFDGGNGQARVLGPEVVALLLEHRQVIAWLAGHVHHHNALWHGRPTADGPSADEGFWEITTSSLIDWPQQARIIEFLRSGDGVHIVSTVVDHDGDVDWASSATNATDLQLAGLSRLLAVNDYHHRGESFRALVLNSRPDLRNVTWTIRDPLPGGRATARPAR